MLLRLMAASSISVPVSLCAGHVGRRTCRRPTRFRAGLRLPRWEDSVWWGYGVQVMSERPFAALVTWLLQETTVPEIPTLAGEILKP